MTRGKDADREEWIPCPGCADFGESRSLEGLFPYSKKHKCRLGSGCRGYFEVGSVKIYSHEIDDMKEVLLLWQSLADLRKAFDKADEEIRGRAESARKELADNPSGEMGDSPARAETMAKWLKMSTRDEGGSEGAKGELLRDDDDVDVSSI